MQLQIDPLDANISLNIIPCLWSLARSVCILPSSFNVEFMHVSAPRVLVSSRAILAFHDGYFVTSARAHQQSVLVFRRARVLSFDATAPGTSASRA